MKNIYTKYKESITGSGLLLLSIALIIFLALFSFKKEARSSSPIKAIIYTQSPIMQEQVNTIDVVNYYEKNGCVYFDDGLKTNNAGVSQYQQICGNYTIKKL